MVKSRIVIKKEERGEDEDDGIVIIMMMKYNNQIGDIPKRTSIKGLKVTSQQQNRSSPSQIVLTKSNLTPPPYKSNSLITFFLTLAKPIFHFDTEKWSNHKNGPFR
ncbi:unnamed protein product [Dovyalis caffra]|uniref:Uncharacterized protein n=1 Tax=Dovyalis caffra TaxID=77055 RepID=A0AAV1RQX1_9ROSI|nr:unnamed protein product [Dovyalis caffra]